MRSTRAAAALIRWAERATRDKLTELPCLDESGSWKSDRFYEVMLRPLGREIEHSRLMARQAHEYGLEHSLDLRDNSTRRLSGRHV